MKRVFSEAKAVVVIFEFYPTGMQQSGTNAAALQECLLPWRWDQFHVHQFRMEDIS